MFRHVTFFPYLFQYSVEALLRLVENVTENSKVDVLVGVASAGIPLAAGVALRIGLPLAYTRKVAGIRTVADLATDSAAWGQHSMVEGLFENGMGYLLVDDVITGGASKNLARQQVELEAERRKVRLHLAGTVVVVDRGFPGHDYSGLGVIAAHRLYDEVEQIYDFGGTKEEVTVIRHYLEDPDVFQDAAARADLLPAPREPHRNRNDSTERLA
jgi:orotate phosphoribosyltransferase